MRKRTLKRSYAPYVASVAVLLLGLGIAGLATDVFPYGRTLPVVWLALAMSCAYEAHVLHRRGAASVPKGDHESDR